MALVKVGAYWINPAGVTYVTHEHGTKEGSPVRVVIVLAGDASGYLIVDGEVDVVAAQLNEAMALSFKPGDVDCVLREPAGAANERLERLKRLRTMGLPRAAEEPPL